MKNKFYFQFSQSMCHFPVQPKCVSKNESEKNEKSGGVDTCNALLIDRTTAPYRPKALSNLEILHFLRFL